MAELTSNTIKVITENPTNIVAVKACSIRAAKNITLPAANDMLRENILKILNNPNAADWLAAILWHVAVTATEINWDDLTSATNATVLEVEAEITAACTTAIYVLSGVEEP